MRDYKDACFDMLRIHVNTNEAVRLLKAKDISGSRSISSFMSRKASCFFVLLALESIDRENIVTDVFNLS